MEEKQIDHRIAFVLSEIASRIYKEINEYISVWT